MNPKRERIQRLLNSMFGPPTFQPETKKRKFKSILDELFKDIGGPNKVKFTESSLLFTMMQAAVPLNIMQIWEEGGVTAKNWAKYVEEFRAYSERCINEPQFTEALVTRIEGKSAEAFNATARMVAILSFVGGGVEIFGCRFNADDYKQFYERKNKNAGNSFRA